MQFLDYYTELNGGNPNHYNPGNPQHLLYSTDKQNHHDYIVSYYDKEFSNLRDSEVRILEIGVLTGTSIRVWGNWFNKGIVYGIDNWFESKQPDLSDVSNAVILTANAYDLQTVAQFEDNYFDYIIDDGPHTEESQLFTVKHWSSKVKPGGKLIVEDIKTPSRCETLAAESQNLPGNYTYTVYDLRFNKGRQLDDDILLEIVKQ